MHKQTLFTRGWKLVSIAILASILLSLLGNVLAEPNVLWDASEPDDSWSETTSYSWPDTTSDASSGFDVFTDGDFQYTVRDGEAIVTGYTGDGGNVTVPNTLGGYPVTVIWEDAFYSNNSLESVVLPDSVTTIGNLAFYNCWRLRNVKLPANLETIESCAFEDCTNLTSITIPASVTRIGEFVFNDCRSLTSITVQAGNTRYSSTGNCLVDLQTSTLLRGCADCVIPDDVKAIEISAFSSCVGLTEIVIPKGVTSIGDIAFRDCSALASITVQAGNTRYSSTGNCLVDLQTSTLLRGCATSEIPGTVTTIGPYAFSACEDLKSIVIPESVTTIENDAFQNCTELQNVKLPSNLVTIGYAAFNRCCSFTSLILPDSVVTVEGAAFLNSDHLLYVFIPENVQTVGREAFRACYSLKVIYCEAKEQPEGWDPDWNSDNVEVIWNTDLADVPVQGIEGDYAYMTADGEATVLSYNGRGGDVTVPDTLGGCPVTVIGEEAFSICENLGSVELPDSVTTIEEGAFCESGLTSIRIPDGVTVIERTTFGGCLRLTNITIPDSVTAIKEFAFGRCYDLENIFIPASVAEMGRNVFESCSSLTIYCEADEQPNGWDPYWNPESADVHWGASRNDVPIEGFEDDCVYSVEDGQATITEFLGSGEDVTVPETVNGYPVTEIGDNAFYGCEDLESVELPSSVTKIGENAFFNCGSLESVNLPSGCAAIGAYAFHGCDSLENIAIPASVTSIGEAAFGSCGSLTSITVQAGNPNYESVGNCLIEKKTGRLLRGCADSVIPNSVKVIGEEAFSFSGLTSVVIPEGVTTIEHDAFWFCGALTNVVIPGSVTSIGSHAFTRCTALKSIVIPKSVVSIGEYAFGSDNGLTVYCEASSKPNGWNANWVDASDGITVKWNYGSPDEPDKPDKPVVVGDLNGDGRANATDYMLLKRHVLGTYKLSDAYLAFADFSGDGRVNSTDYMLLKRAVLGTYKLAAK